MAHRIGKREDIGDGLVRLIKEDLLAARTALSENDPPIAQLDRVRHRIRRVHLVLRVLRPSIGAVATDTVGSLRDAARLLAGKPVTDPASATALIPIANEGGEDLDLAIATLDRQTHSDSVDVKTIARIDERLAAAERDLAVPTDRIDGKDLLAKAVDRTYRRGRKAMQRETFSLVTPEFHDWRKSVKDLWYLIRLARKRLPPRARLLAARLERLDEVLGRDHDHAMRAERLALSPTGDPALMQKLSVIAEHRRDLAKEAFALGGRVYKAKPKTFRQRMVLK